MARLFLEVLYAYREQVSFGLHEFVLMPDHFHLLVSVPPGLTLEKVVQQAQTCFFRSAALRWGFLDEPRT